MKIFETENSRYIFNETTKCYRREPLTIQTTPESHRLLYHTWIPYREFEKVENVYKDPILHILALDSVLGIFTSPIMKEYEAEDVSALEQIE